jgi:hypothetical protein
VFSLCLAELSRAAINTLVTQEREGSRVRVRSDATIKAVSCEIEGLYEFTVGVIGEFSIADSHRRFISEDEE